uniref:Uncharacterized protein n=1 Tax=Arundo donax TaxID=35708 RepID=A0A0A9CH30_ARUDO
MATAIDRLWRPPHSLLQNDKDRHVQP